MGEQYERFLKIVRSIVDRRIDDIHGNLNGLARHFADSVLPVIESNEAVRPVLDAFNVQDNRVRQAFEAELRFFNEKYENDVVNSRATEDADTVKSSLVKLLWSELPDWLRKMFIMDPKNWTTH